MNVFHEEQPITTAARCRLALREQPAQREVLVELARALSQLWSYSESRRCLQKAALLSLDRRLDQALVSQELGSLYLQKGVLAPAQRWYERALELDSGNANHWLHYGVCLARRGMLEEAERALTSGLRRPRARTWENQYWKGWVLRAQGRFQEAASYLASGSEWEAEDCRKSLTQGDQEGGPVSKWRWACQQIIEHPRDASHYVLQATSLAKMGQLQAALKALRQAWDIIPLPTYKWSSLALILADCGRYRQAADCCERAQPAQYAGNWFIRAGLYRAQAGQSQAAQECVLKGMQMDNTYLDQAYLGLGRMHAGRAEYAEASAYFRRALALNHADEEARSALTDVLTAQNL